MKELNYLYGQPKSSADFKTSAEDFMVDEILDIPLTGEGEHVCLQVIKKGENTQFIAKQLAKFVGIAPRDVSYAGLKDRHGVCSQWFSVPVPIKKDIDFSALNSDSIFVVKQIRHNRKLRTGCHSGNHFKIILRNVDMPLDILSRINAVRQGIPNYFGEQRFGHGGHNLEMAERLFGGEHIRDKKLRGIVISAARSHIFNQLVSLRVAEHGLAKTWHREVFLLSGSNAFFEDDINDEIIARLSSGDIVLSAPMVGKGEKGLVEQERQWLQPYSAWQQGLGELGLKVERRALRLVPKDLQVETIDSDTIKLSFSLPKGTFATAVLRELVLHRDASKDNLTQGVIDASIAQ
ncbi:tRNA pseudouridine synthase D [Pseudoalteromonas holothuriae]|uniref:tRNA pseudouridine synthase D n=1 Tax=Pseudoalteromonas holothuriae TaxID=2963714 RepID=A0A9W4QW41_9GAMM|nr:MULTISPECIES: tRNA pseudouridine(13) synthase TruD [unclassified Pseudoalteromonas]CAH9053235.1 tRNA pseudouridine synthase D [Pseudoalteromonas sp. CIP111951]CAH9056284.1 tRNA pseudouridine synthase D [Pseudoalteromonas sp. CIP111854]